MSRAARHNAEEDMGAWLVSGELDHLLLAFWQVLRYVEIRDAYPMMALRALDKQPHFVSLVHSYGAGRELEIACCYRELLDLPARLWCRRTACST